MALSEETDPRPGPETRRGADLAAIGEGVDRRLHAFLDREHAVFAENDPALVPLIDAVRRLLAAGGKRIRPAFVYWGHRATGAAHDETVYVPAAAVELFHAFALIHDDVMDRAATRRGEPSAHEAFTAAHRDEASTGDAEWFGLSAAILAGDLAAAWSGRLFEETGYPADVMGRARSTFARLQIEVIAGQYLEMRLTGRPSTTETEVLRVGLLKSGRYTVTRPLLIGAALGGGGPQVTETLRAYGDAVGVAFQLRDDILGLYGDPARTGKGDDGDVREGKRTLLVVRALERATTDERGFLTRALGDPDVSADDVDRVRDVVRRTGALDDIEQIVQRRREQAVEAIRTLPDEARTALVELADLAINRTA